MKNISIALIIILFFINLYSIDVPIYPKDWAILNNSEKVYAAFDDFWVPKYHDVQIALYAVYRHIQNLRSDQHLPGAGRAEIVRILDNWKLFKVQFAGIIKDGKKIIFCNFFDRRMNAKDWQKEQVIADDTSYFYWNIEYDPAAKTFAHFKSGTYEE